MRSRHSAQIRRIRDWLSLCAAIALIPWTVYLGLTLPQSYNAQHWQVTWVGFDVLLLAFMTATAVLGFIHHNLLTLFAFATGVLLVCEAWFDVLTAKRGDFAVSVLTAVLGRVATRSGPDQWSVAHCSAASLPIQSAMVALPAPRQIDPWVPNGRKP